jgi:nucleoside-diphosphate-sugar epimerase
LTNSNSLIQFSDIRVGEIGGYVANISRAKDLLGYIPRFSLVEGLKESIAWYSQRLNEYIEATKHDLKKG